MAFNMKGWSAFKKDDHVGPGKRFKTKEEKERWDKRFYEQWKKKQEKDQSGIHIT